MPCLNLKLSPKIDHISDPLMVLPPKYKNLVSRLIELTFLN